MAELKLHGIVFFVCLFLFVFFVVVFLVVFHCKHAVKKTLNLAVMSL